MEASGSASRVLGKRHLLSRRLTGVDPQLLRLLGRRLLRGVDLAHERVDLVLAEFFKSGL